MTEERISMDSRKPEPGVDPAASPLPGKRVLVLSGDRRERERLAAFLAGWGISAQVAANSVEALTRIGDAAERNRGMDLVLFSARGHRVTGEQFAAVLRSDSRLRALPLLHLGEPMGPAHEAGLRKAGFVEVIPTPLDKTLLFAGLHRVWARDSVDPGVAQLIDRYRASGPSLPPLGILLVEPDKAQRALVARALAPGGHHIFEVDHGEQALEALNSHSFDLVLIALDLPGIGGAETVRLFHFSRPREDWPPFVGMADHAEASEVRGWQQADMAAFLTRPVESKTLLCTMAQALRLGGPETTGGSEANGADRAESGLPVVDEQVLRRLDRLGSDPGFLARLLDEFLREVGTLVRDTRASCGSARFYSDLLQLGHTLKDSAGNLGALRLYHLGLAASYLAEPEVEPEGTHLLDQIEEAFACTRDLFVRYLDRRGFSLRSI
jgi:two-component system sensor histidine kinase RpfC